MKFLRFGNAGEEKPGLVDQSGKIRDLSSVIDDIKGNTLISCSSNEIKKKGINISISKEVGLTLAKKAMSAGIKNVVFDRSGYKYHGKVKSFAEGAREGGLKF